MKVSARLNLSSRTQIGAGLPGRSAIVCYVVAVQAHSVEAKFNLGSFYERGLGVMKGGSLALVWYR